MATQLEIERLAVLETKVAGIEDRTQRIETKIDTLGEKLDNNFVRQSVVDELQKDIDHRLNEIKIQLFNMKDDKTNEKWVLRLILAISVIMNVIGIYNLFTIK